MLPSADARAMRELEASAGLDNDAGHPMARDAWSLAGVLMFAAEDHILAMCSLLEWRSMPVYAHTVLARAALEASLWAAWLSDAEVDVRHRVGRYITKRIGDAEQDAQLAQAAGDPYQAKAARERARALKERAERVGLPVLPSRKNQPREVGEPRPSMTKLARKYLDPDERAGSLGATLWKSYCGVAHAAVHALRSAIETEGDSDPLQPGVASAAFVTRSREVQFVLAATALAYVPAMGACVALMGWQNETEWLAATGQIFTVFEGSFPPIDSGLAPYKPGRCSSQLQHAAEHRVCFWW